MSRTVISAVLLISAFFVAPGNCDTSVREIELSIVSGVVTAVDWVGDKLIIRTFYGGQADELNFLVPDKAVITKGAANITFGNINIADKVTVQYYSDLSGLRAVRITVK